MFSPAREPASCTCVHTSVFLSNTVAQTCDGLTQMCSEGTPAPKSVGAQKSIDGSEGEDQDSVSDVVLPAVGVGRAEVAGRYREGIAVAEQEGVSRAGPVREKVVAPAPPVVDGQQVGRVDERVLAAEAARVVDGLDAGAWHHEWLAINRDVEGSACGIGVDLRPVACGQRSNDLDQRPVDHNR